MLPVLRLLSPVASAANCDTPSNPKGPVFFALCFAARKLERLMPLEVSSLSHHFLTPMLRLQTPSTVGG
jgi:hypothetical protein